MLIQQGDVLISKVNSIPKAAKTLYPKSRGYVLAEGETTGHAHVITDTASVEMYETDEQVYMKVLKEITVTHEEHNPVVVEPGIYQVGKVQEYDHFAEEAKAVQD
jgi:hypothetical protein